jgi:tetratricopeptide (TPR) repeat protein
VLFDLKGRRRRVVQVTYLLLAILMGGGLVLFGIGGDVSGGLFDAISGNSTSSNSIVEDRIDRNEDKVATDPKDETALKELARDWYQLANDEADPNTGQFTDEGKERLANADEAWQRYLDLEPKKPDPALAGLMLNVYAPTALNKAAEGAEAAEIVAVATPRADAAQAYLQLATFAAAAGQDRKADLAGQKAVELAPKNQRSTVKQLVKQATQAPPPASTTTTPSG